MLQSEKVTRVKIVVRGSVIPENKRQLEAFDSRVVLTEELCESECKLNVFFGSALAFYYVFHDNPKNEIRNSAFYLESDEFNCYLQQLEPLFQWFVKNVPNLTFVVLDAIKLNTLFIHSGD